MLVTGRHQLDVGHGAGVRGLVPLFILLPVRGRHCVAQDGGRSLCVQRAAFQAVGGINAYLRKLLVDGLRQLRRPALRQLHVRNALPYPRQAQVNG